MALGRLRRSLCVPPSTSHPSHAGDTVTLRLVAPLEPDLYSVYLRLLDQPGKAQLTVVTARVCDCEGPAQGCPQRPQPATGLPFVLAALGALLALLREWGVPRGPRAAPSPPPPRGAGGDTSWLTPLLPRPSHPPAAAALCEEEEGDEGATAAARG